MSIAIVYDVEYPKRYPFTDLNFFMNIVMSIKNAQPVVFDQINMSEMLEDLDVFDAVVFMPNSLHDSYIYKFFARKNVQEALLRNVRRGLGILMLHQSSVNEYILSEKLGVNIIPQPNFGDIPMIQNNQHPVLSDLEGFIDTLLADYNKIRRTDPIVGRYALFTFSIDPLSPVNWLFRDNVKGKEYIRCAEIRYGMGKIIFLPAHFDWFKIGSPFLKNLVDYILKRSYISYKLDLVGEYKSKFSRITINTEAKSTTLFVGSRIYGDNLYIKLFKPAWLSWILADRIIRLFEPASRNEYQGIPLIRNSPTMTLDVLFPLIALDPTNIMYYKIFVNIVDKTLPKNKYDTLLHSVSFIRCIGIFDIIKTAMPQQDYKDIKKSVDKIFDSIINTVQNADVHTRNITGLLIQMHKELIKTDFVLKRILDPEKYNDSYTHRLLGIMEEKISRKYEPKDLYLSYDSIIKILHKNIAGPRLLAEALITLMINPEFELFWLITEHLYLSWSDVAETYMPKKSAIRDTDILIRRLEETVNRLRSQYLNAIDKVHKLETELAHLKKRWLVIKGKTTSDFKNWLKTNVAKVIGVISALLLIWRFIELILSLLP